ncbi:MAG: hypothetical protein L0G94_18750 [Brachybacterium sp.]|uniref:hypothetical protein n=1 Tax=Brachybacterium sp. TaxID=1891286 RepID=UPI00264823F8|nr:hypothetical protein [Brachybacterium sp.]MDN5688695.1 hypothetical protein [Brachybacterium sp.]
MDWVEGTTRVFTSIGSIVGAVVALGALIGTIGRVSQIPRARRRVIRAAELEDQAHPSLRGRYAALHREQSARYLALVEARIGREPVSTVLAAVIALLSAFVILVMMAWNGGNPHVWPETLSTVIPFAITYGFVLWMVLDQSSSRSRTFVRAYRAHVGPENTKTPDPGERIDWLIRKLGDEAAYRLLLAVSIVSSALLVAVGGHAIGRNFTEFGRAMKEDDGQWIWLATTMAILVLLIVAAASVILLFPQLPRLGESLRAGAEAEPALADPVEGGSSGASGSDSPASGNSPER